MNDFLRDIVRWWFVTSMVLAVLMVCPAMAQELGPEEFSLFPSPTAWDPGPATARSGGLGFPGGATWSLMPAGVPAPTTFDQDHELPSVSFDVLSPAGTADEVAIIGAALDVWAAASGFVNLGQVADGGVVPGAPATVAPASGGDDGDIRIGLFDFPAAETVPLGHAFRPAVEGISIGTWGGEVHLNSFVNAEDAVWVDDPLGLNAAGTFDLFTVVLHELGHALGLRHSTDPSAVMTAGYAGTRRELSADDIAGIQTLYGPPSVVPEPSGLVLLAIGVAMLRRHVGRRLRRDA